MCNPFSNGASDGTVTNRFIDLCPDGVIGVDAAGIIRIFNQKAVSMTQRAADTVLGKLHIREIYGSLDHAKAVKAAIYAESHGGNGSLEGYETEILDVNGSAIPIRLSAILIMKNTEEIGSIGFFHDMSQQKALEAKLRLLSITDGLTGLFNQRHFYTRLADELARTARYGRPLSMVTMDLDRFKECNDRFGHLEGDNVLRLVGDLMRAVTRRSDQSFRYGGDEFFVILPETDLQQAVVMAEKIRTTFNARWPYDAADSNAPRVTLSIGVAQSAGEAEPEAFIRRADMAMYAAKQAGGDRISVDDTTP
ncbi:MAG: diguanylate cyclase [Pseudomonadota bacterium]